MASFSYKHNTFQNSITLSLPLEYPLIGPISIADLFHHHSLFFSLKHLRRFGSSAPLNLGPSSGEKLRCKTHEEEGRSKPLPFITSRLGKGHSFLYPSSSIIRASYSPPYSYPCVGARSRLAHSHILVIAADYHHHRSRLPSSFLPLFLLVSQAQGWYKSTLSYLACMSFR